MDLISYKKAKEARELAEQVIDESFDKGVLNTEIEQRLGNLETEYTPRLSSAEQKIEDNFNSVSSQLAQKAQQLDLNAVDSRVTETNTRIDNIIATPTTVSEQEIIDARQGEASLGANVQKIKGQIESTIINKISNGNFENDLTSWTLGGAVVPTISTEAAKSGTKSVKFSTTTQSSTALQNITAVEGDIIYASLWANLVSFTDATDVDSVLGVSDYGGYTNVQAFKLDKTKLNQWQFVSGIKTSPLNGVRVFGGSVASLTRVVYVDNVMTINLTEVFGKGNEPTKEIMDEMIGYFTNSWFDSKAKANETQFSLLQSMMKRKSEIINVKSYGAKGDGVTDDTKALQSAFNDGAGKIVFMPNGTYKITKTLFIKSNTTIQGCGESSKIILGDGYDLTQMVYRDYYEGQSHIQFFVYPMIATETGSKNIVTRDFSITGNKTVSSDKRQIGLAFIDCENAIAERVNIDYINYFPVYAEANYPALVLGYCIGTFRSKNITIRGGRYEYGGYETIGIADDTENALVDGVYCGAGWRTSFQIHRGCKNVKVVNSFIIQEDNEAATEPSGAVILHGNVATNQSIEDVVFSNNTIIIEYDNDASGIHTIGTGEDNLIIENNKIFATRHTVYLKNNKNVTVKNNRLFSSYSNVELQSNLENIRIVDNDMYNTGAYTSQTEACVRIQNAIVNGLWIKGNNMVSDTVPALRFFGSTDQTLNDLSIVNNVMKVAQHAIYTWTLTEAKVTLNNLSITDNTIESVGGNGIYLDHANSADGWIIRGNKIKVDTNKTAILLEAPILRAIITENIVKQANEGIKLSDTASSVLVTYNDLVNATTPITQGTGLNHIIKDNFVG